MNAKKLARALGWFSLGLGLTELVAPRAVTWFLGLSKGTGVTRLYGLREIASGVSILIHANPAPWVWARIAGDLMNLAALGSARKGSLKKGRFGAALGSAAAATALDVLCARRLGINPL